MLSLLNFQVAKHLEVAVQSLAWEAKSSTQFAVCQMGNGAATTQAWLHEWGQGGNTIPYPVCGKLGWSALRAR